MQGPRDKLLAGAGLAGDEYIDLRMRQPTNGAKHLLHGRRLANEHGLPAVGVGTGRRILAAGTGGPTHQVDRIIDIKRLGQILEGTALVGGHRTVQIGMRGHDDGGQTGPGVLQAA